MSDRERTLRPGDIRIGEIPPGYAMVVVICREHVGTAYDRVLALVEPSTPAEGSAEANLALAACSAFEFARRLARGNFTAGRSDPQ
jgi:hypothetical protein